MLYLAERKEGERSQGEGRYGFFVGEACNWQVQGAAGERICFARMGTFSCTLGNSLEETPVPC